MKKKVAIVDPASYTLPYDFYYIHEIAKAFNVDFYCSTTPFNWEYVEKLANIPGVKILPYSVSAVSKLRGFTNYMRMLFCLFKKRSDYHTIHFQFQILRGISAWIELGFFKAVHEKLIFTMHSPVPHGYSKRKTYWIFHYIAKFAYRLVFVSSYTLGRFVGDYNYTGKTSLAQLGLMPLKPDENLPPVHFQSLEKTIVVWGNIKPYKGIELLAEMAESCQFSDFRFEVYGKWDPGMEQLLKRLQACNIQVTNRFLEDDELRELLRRPVIFIFPYLNVTQSGVLYTLLFYGACFITSNSGDNAHFANRHNMKEIVFERNDLQSIRKSLEYVVQNHEKLIGKLAAIRDQYDWNALTPDPRSIYTGKTMNQE